MVDLNQKRNEFIENLSKVNSLIELEELKASELGKKGTVTSLMQSLASMSIEEKKVMGASLNEYKNFIADKIAEKKAHIEMILLNQKLEAEAIDLSLSSRPKQCGKIHPLSQVTEELVNLFAAQGFSAMIGPDIENDQHNFTALNIPEHHPARNMHDTFYLKSKDEKGNPHLLRTHTSNTQIRTMLKGKPPFRFVSPGRTYRYESDMTHSPMFHQIEGLCIDKNINMGHLKGCLVEFLKSFFQLDDIKIRFRPSFFPFTEPSAELDIGYSLENGELKLGQGDRWLEILGCGMVHPNVLRNVGIDPEVYQGFAFGMGIERVAMLKYGINDLRKFFENDVRWLSHFGFHMLDIPNVATGN